MFNVLEQLSRTIYVYTANYRLVLRSFGFSAADRAYMRYRKRHTVFGVADTAHDLGDNISCLAYCYYIADPYILAVDLVLIMKHCS